MKNAKTVARLYIDSLNNINKKDRNIICVSKLDTY